MNQSILKKARLLIIEIEEIKSTKETKNITGILNLVNEALRDAEALAREINTNHVLTSWYQLHKSRIEKNAERERGNLWMNIVNI